VVHLVKASLASGELDAPLIGEREPRYVARVLSPRVAASVSALTIPGLICQGEGLSPVAVVYFLGIQYRPDIAVCNYRDRILAVEVKFIRAGQFSAQVALALGQATLYRKGGFMASAALIIDLEDRIAHFDLEHAGSLFSDEATDVMFFKRSGKKIVPYPKGVVEGSSP
jgi:hypothetical protein